MSESFREDGHEKLQQWCHWLLCMWMYENNPGPAVGTIQYNTPGVQVSLCCSQMMLPEGGEAGKETKWHGDESRIQPGTNDGGKYAKKGGVM